MSAERKPVNVDALRGHTPGPWRYQRENGSPTTGQHMIAGAIPGYLAEVRDCGSGDVGANGRLIAAAPDLLAEVIERRARDAAVADLIEVAERACDRMSETMGMKQAEADLRVSLAALRGETP